MLILDNITIIICIVLLLIALLSIVTDSFLRRISTGSSVNEKLNLPSVSVIIIAENSSSELERHIPAFLSQNYPSGYEVIIVAGKNEDDTDDIIKKFGNHNNLYATFVPDSSRYMSRRKLAITLGVKASRNNLIILTDADCSPNTQDWIMSMASKSVSEHADIVIGYSNYDVGTKSFRIFEHLFRSYNFMREAADGHPYAMSGKNLLFKKDIFMEEKGFQGNLKYLRGEYEFLVNKFGDHYNVAVSTDSRGFITEDRPSKRTFINQCVFYAETRKHLLRGLGHRVVCNIDVLFLNIGFWAPIAAGFYSGFTNRWIELGIALLTLVIPIITRTMTASRAVAIFKAPISKRSLFLNEMLLVFHSISIIWKHKKADKADFISHKS